MSKRGRILPAESVHPPTQGKSVPLGPSPGHSEVWRLLGLVQGVVEPAPAGSLTLPVLLLMALLVTCGTPGLDKDKCYPGPLCKESCHLWAPVSWL